MKTLQNSIPTFGRREKIGLVQTRSRRAMSEEEREWTPNPRQKRHSIIRQDVGPSSLVRIVLGHVFGR
jgi:hypothetical protein